MTKREQQDRDRMFNALMKLGFSFEECNKLRRISLTLRRWYELECGTENDYGTSFAIERGFMRGGEFVSCANEEECKELGATCRPYMRVAYMSNGQFHETHHMVPDRERGAIKRLDAILAPYKRRLTYYLQTDPRGCALYIVPLASLRRLGLTRKDIDSCYSSVGIAVY